MSVINSLPTWARAEAQAFRDTGHLSGDNVKKQPVPPGVQDQVEGQFTQQMDALVKCDETQLDQAKGQPGFVKTDALGMEATAHFEGDLTKNGSATIEADLGPMKTAAFIQVDEQATTLVQVLDFGQDNVGTFAARFDKQNPTESYFEVKNVPDEFNIFAG